MIDIMCTINVLVVEWWSAILWLNWSCLEVDKPTVLLEEYFTKIACFHIVSSWCRAGLSKGKRLISLIYSDCVVNETSWYKLLVVDAQRKELRRLNFFFTNRVTKKTRSGVKQTITIANEVLKDNFDKVAEKQRTELWLEEYPTKLNFCRANKTTHSNMAYV